MSTLSRGVHTQQSRYGLDPTYSRPPVDSMSASVAGTAHRPTSSVTSSIPHYPYSTTAALTSTSPLSTSDDRSAAIAEYVEKRRQAKLNAESIRSERAREAEMRRVDGRGPSAANSSASSSPSLPRSGIVIGASSASSSSSSSLSSSRRVSRGRDSGEWNHSGANSGIGRFADEDEHEATSGSERAKQRTDAAEEEEQEEQQEDDEHDEPLHRYAKPLSRTSTTQLSTQQRVQRHGAQQRPSARPVSPSAASTASRLTDSSATPMNGALLQSRVAGLEAQVAALHSQQRLFLAFMETTQSQLAILRGTALTAPRAAADSTDSAQTVSSRHAQHQPSAQRNAPLPASRRPAQDSRVQQYQQYGEYKDETLERGGRHSGLADLRRMRDEEEHDRLEEEDGAASYSAIIHSRTTQAITHRKQPTRSSDGSDQPAPTVSRTDRPDEQYYTSSSANKQPTAQSQQRTPSRSPPAPTQAAASHHSSLSASHFDSADVLLEADPFPVQSTFPCPNCGRSFNEAALERHVAKALCQKMARKPFDVAAQRLQDVKSELGAAKAKERKGAGGASRKQQQQQDESAAAKQSKWRQERARLQEAIQAGKQLTLALKEGRPLASIPVAVSSLPDDRVQCPHCSRKFAEQTAERHIPHCKNTASRMNAVGNAAQRRK